MAFGIFSSGVQTFVYKIVYFGYIICLEHIIFKHTDPGVNHAGFSSILANHDIHNIEHAAVPHP